MDMWGKLVYNLCLVPRGPVTGTDHFFPGYHAVIMRLNLWLEVRHRTCSEKRLKKRGRPRKWSTAQPIAPEPWKAPPEAMPMN
jgi:hypothetical protein